MGKTSRRLRAIILSGVFLCVFAGLRRPAFGQDAPASTAGQQATPQAQSSTPVDPPAVQTQPAANSNAPKNDRIFWALPNLLTVENGSDSPPLPTGQKFKLVAQGTFDPFEFAFIGMVASVNQASNSNPSYGQGLVGYSKRYGTAFADNAIGNFMTGAVYPAMLHQDPRYFQMGKGNFFRRAFYAGTRVFVIRGDSGKTELNFSELLGNGTAAAISNAYHPGPRTIDSNLAVWWTQIGWDAVAYELKEFWPDIHRLIRHGKQPNM